MASPPPPRNPDQLVLRGGATSVLDLPLPDPALTGFHPAVAEWFRRRFADGPTTPQREGWPAIAAGHHVISQFDGFEQLLDFNGDMLPAAFANERTDWALGTIGRSTDEFQVTKQADVLTLFYLLPEKEVFALLQHMGYHFGHAALLRTAHYYLERSVHDSSLSHVVYAGALARVDPVPRAARGRRLARGGAVADGVE